MARYSESELVSLVTGEIQASLTDEYSALSEQRAAAHKYYNGELPLKPEVNTSGHVARTVFDSVESIKGKLLRVFTSNRNVVRFQPVSEDDVKGAQLRTEYTQAVMRDNNPYQLLHDLLHDALLTKLACVKRVVEERSVLQVEEFTGQPMELLQNLPALDEAIEGIELTSVYDQVVTLDTPYGPAQRVVQVADGSLQRRKNTVRVDVEAIPPEDVFFGAGTSDPNKADFVAVRYRKPKYELVELGIDAELLEKVSSTDDLHFTNDKQARHSYDGTYGHEDAGRGERELVTVYEAYVRLDMDTPKGEPPVRAALWKVLIAGNQLLDSERLDEIPLRFWTPIMVSHKAIGLSEADVTMDLQKSDSNIVRGLIDHIYRTNTGLRRVDMTLVRNPRDLITNPIGGIINAPDNARIDVIPQAPLSSATGQVLELLAGEREARTGDTRLGRGLQSQDVLTHQNSEGMITKLMNAGNERVMQMARSFAEILWKPLMLDVYRLGYDAGQVVVMDVDGTFQPFDPRTIPYGEEMTVDVALTPEYGESRAQQLLSIATVINSDPELKPLYGAKEKYALMSEVFDLLGQPNWLAAPDDPEVQQRVMQAQARQKGDEDFQKALVARQFGIKEAEVELKREKLGLDAAVAADKQDLDEAEFEWQKKVDVAEFSLEKSQKRPVGLN
jgi:hypothetical protein